jgi:iron complex outermembrane receptor protein
VTWKPAEGLDLAAGIRSARDTQSYTSVVGGAGLPTTDESGQSLAQVTTWLATVRYRFAPQVMGYARVATGGQPGAPVGPEYSIQPGVPPIIEKVTTSESGVKSEFLDRRLLFDFSVYYMNWKNIQLPDTNAATAASYTANGGNATTKGLELASSISPIQNLTLGGNAAYTRAAFTSVNPGLQYVLPGYQLSNVPNWAVS